MLNQTGEGLLAGSRAMTLCPAACDGCVRAKIEDPFRVIKRQFGLLKVRLRGLDKNTAHVTLFALSNLWMARRQLMAMAARPRRA